MKKIILFSIALIIHLQLHCQKTLSLDECREMALSNNKSLEIANQNVLAARQLKAAVFSQFLPNFSANGVYTWNEKNVSLLSENALLPVGAKMADGSFGFRADQISNGWSMINGQPIPLDANNTPFNPATNPEKIQWKNYAILPKESMEFNIRNVFAGTVGFVQPVFMGGKIRELYRISKYSVSLAEAQKENKTADLLLEVDEAFWRIISVENKLKLATEYRNLVEKLHENVKLMVEEGVATKADLLKVKVKLNEAELSLTKAENGLSLSRMVLNQLCGYQLDEIFILSEAELNKEPTAKLTSIDDAINNRPEIKALTQLENIAKSNERIMVSRFLPSVALSGNYLISNPNVYDGYKKEFGGMFTVGVVANVPLFHFGDKFHTLKAAQVQRKVTILQIDEVKEKMQLQIKQSAYKMAESLKKKKATKTNVEQAEENLRYATDGFTEGVITSTDLLGAQTAWLLAKSEDIDAIIDAKLCDLYLSKSMGQINI